MKKNYAFLLTAILCVTEISNAQSPDWLWARGLGSSQDDRSNSVVVDASGNVYTTGRFYGTIDFDPGPGTFYLTASGGPASFVYKLDSAGNFIWAKAFTGTGLGMGNALVVSGSNGDIYSTGYYSGTVDFDPGPGIFNMGTMSSVLNIYVSRLDSSGNFVWAKAMGGNDHAIGQSIGLDALGNVYTGGDFWSTIDFDPGPGVYNLTALPVATLPDGYISKLDTSGNFLWAISFRGTSENAVQSLTVDPAGSVYSTGYFVGTVDFDPGAGTYNLLSSFGGGSYDCFISKLDSSGHLVWAKKLDGTWDDYGYSVKIDPSGSGPVYITGSFNDTVDFDPGPGVYKLRTMSGQNSQSFILKLDSAGNFIWARATEGSGNSNPWSLALSPVNGDVYITGGMTDTVDMDPGTGVFNLVSIGGGDGYITRLNSSGTFVWAKGLGGTNNDYGRSVTMDASGNCFVTGMFSSPTLICGADTLTGHSSSAFIHDFFIARLDTHALLTGIPVAYLDPELTVFPNPAINDFTVLLSREYPVTHVSITDITGKIIFETEVKSTRHITVQSINFAAGIYFIQIRQDGRRQCRKLIVTK